jgi:glycosyltransferase involved in cell wall biosynthesis
MNILHISTSSSGGAGIAAKRLHLFLRNSGISSLMQVKQTRENFPGLKIISTPKRPIRQLSKTERLRRKLHRLSVELRISPPQPQIQSRWNLELKRQQEFLASRDKKLDIFSFPLSLERLTESIEFNQADIIHFHWMPGILDWSDFFIKNGKPLVWTLHDAYPFLGGRHYIETIGNPNEVGQPIQLSISENEIREEKALLMFKKDALANCRKLHVISPSNWLMRESKVSHNLGDFPHSLIRNGCPTGTFKIYKKDLIRQVLNLPAPKQIFLFIADSVNIYRKGLAYLIAAAKTLNSTACILIVGIDEIEVETAAEVRCLGKIYDERYLALVYAAADFLILPSLADNLPNTMLEALCCGLPVIGFPVGGIPEVVGEQFGNGIICDEISVSGLADAISKGISMKGSFDSNYIAQNAAKLFNPETIAEQHISLYKSILESR